MGHRFCRQCRCWYGQDHVAAGREVEKQDMQISLCTRDYLLFQKPTNGSKNAVLHAEYCTRKKTDLAED
jgi:hypothetical protein